MSRKPVNPTNEDELTGMRKAAIVLIMLGDQTSAELLKQLPDEEVQTLSREVAKLGVVSATHAETALEEFYQMTTARDFLVQGGIDYAKSMLINAFGPDAAKRVLDRVIKALGEDSANFDALQKADPQQLAKFVHNEHPQTIALVLSHLNSSQAGALLTSLPTELRADVALRMASLDQISPEVIQKIAAVIGQKLHALGEFSRESYGGVRAVSEVFNRMDSEVALEILSVMQDQEPTMVETIRQLMFVFEDMLTLDQNAIKEILARVDRKLLTMALKGTSEQLRTHFTSCLSQRGAEMLKEDMEAIGPVKIKDVETAQQQIIAVVRQLEAEGVVNLGGTSGEQYVD
jgi:flagellar motor switch protein FliG